MKMFRKNIINAFLILVVICASCRNNNNLNAKFEGIISESFLNLANSKKVDLSTVVDDYENIEYVRYTNLDKYYYNGKLVNKAFPYEGDIECYDKDDNLVRIDKNVYRILLTNNDKLANEEITSDGYLSNKFGMLNLDEGFYKSDDTYYYVSGETHKVVDCSNATSSNVIQKIKRQVISKNGEKYIIYIDEEKNGELVKNQISNISGEIYLTDENGKIVSKNGLYEVSNIYDNTLHLIYEGLDGKIKKNHEKFFSCYVNENGKVVVGDRVKKDGKSYFADFDGRLNEDEYFFTLGYFDKEKLENLVDGKISSDKSYIKYILYNINKKDINKSNVLYNKSRENGAEYNFYIMSKDDTSIATNSEAAILNSQVSTKSEVESSDTNAIADGFMEMISGMLYDELQKDRKVYVKNKTGELVKNKIIEYSNRRYYVGNEGIIQKDKIINIDGKEMLIDKKGNIVRDTWIFDKRYYDNKKLESNIAPYISGYEVDRNIIKPYLGYYVLSTGEILKDDIYIESSINDINDITGNTEIVFKTKNGEYDGTYDKNLYFINTFRKGDEKYNYEEHAEGSFAYIHRYTDKDRKIKIDDKNIDQQVTYRYKVSDVKRLNRDTVYFGSYPNHDVSGEVFEPLEWIILDKNGNEALLLSKNIIDSKVFDENGSNNWNESSLNRWLNELFIDLAFTDEEKKRIIKKGVSEKIFLLDKNVYDNFENKAGKFQLLAPTTNYAVRDSDDVMKRFFMHNWLRSKQVDGLKGYVDTEWLGTGFSNDPKEVGGVRPAIYIKINESKSN